MAKAKPQATEADVFDGATLVETAQDNDFSQPELEKDSGPRGAAMETQLQAIRDERAAQRAARGPATKKRRVTNYHDAERLSALVKAGHTHLATAAEIVDWEEDGLLPDPAHYATGTGAEKAAIAMQGSIVPPVAATPPDESV